MSQLVRIGEEDVELGEVVKAAATNSSFYNQVFFPKTVRQKGPEQHVEVLRRLDDPTKRYVNLKMFRGSAKTTLLRLYTSKRIALGTSKTILYIGASEPHAIRSIMWLRGQVERNSFWAGAFGLSQGKKWNENEIEIRSKLLDDPIWVLGVGITGNIRGINFDDYRPDLIILDDVITDENAATLEQRDKTSKLILGAVKESLTPATEEPNAKLAMLQTPIHPEDASAEAAVDPQWDTYTMSCWTPETADLPLEEQKSSWETRFPSETLRAEKASALARNRYSTWAKEMECKLLTPELSTFRTGWVGFWEEKPKNSFNILVIDPVPPPSPAQMAKGLVGKDSEAHAVIGRKDGSYYALEVVSNKGHQPNWTISNALEMAYRHKVTRIVLLAVGYETVLQKQLKDGMVKQGRYWPVDILPTEGRSKFARITGWLSGPASNGRVFFHQSQSTLLAQFSEYGPTYSGHDDELEAVAAGIGQLASPYLELGEDEYSRAGTAEDDDDNFFSRGAP